MEIVNYILGFNFILSGIYCALIGFKLFKPKLEDSKKEKWNDWFNKYNLRLKVLSVPLLIFGVYLILNPNFIEF